MDQCDPGAFRAARATLPRNFQWGRGSLRRKPGSSRPGRTDTPAADLVYGPRDLGSGPRDLGSPPSTLAPNIPRRGVIGFDERPPDSRGACTPSRKVDWGQREGLSFLRSDSPIRSFLP